MDSTHESDSRFDDLVHCYGHVIRCPLDLEPRDWVIALCLDLGRRAKADLLNVHTATGMDSSVIISYTLHSSGGRVALASRSVG
jgi:hypothetical protein